MQPNLIIIGAMKAGTTSLHNYLDSHSEISMTTVKETNFFSNPKYWSKGTSWYFGQFNGDTTIRGESSTSYTAFPFIKDVPHRIHSTLPEVKLLYLVRDPVDRLVSHYGHNLSNGTETRTISEVVAEIRQGMETRYVRQSQYFCQIQQFLEYFDESHIRVVSSEALQRQQSMVLSNVCEFLGVAPKFPDDILAKKWHKGRDKFAKTLWGKICYPHWLQTHPTLPWKLKAPFHRLAKIGARHINRPTLSDDDAKALIDVFQPDVQQLKEFTKSSFEEWSSF